MPPPPIPTYRHQPLEPYQLNGKLRSLNISEAEFSRLTGVRVKTLAQWLDEHTADRPPPHWVRVFLDLMADSAARARAHEITDRYLLDEETYRARRDQKEAAR